VIRLGVNIDHVATVREARKTIVPDPIRAALIAEDAGCDGITAHLRQDERHIKKEDIKRLKENIGTKLNIELSTRKDIVGYVKDIKPHWACLVPERVEEVTTEGGLDIFKQEEELQNVIPELKKEGIRVTLFIEPDKEIVEKAKSLGADAIEFNTKSYAQNPNSEMEKKRIAESGRYASSLGLEVHAGHDLNYDNLEGITKIKVVEEVNIGHAIIARAIFTGLETAVKEMLNILNR
jgi:pyridoxine 5-phosphate synthase